MKLARIALILSAIAALGGCVAYPAGPGYYAPEAAYYPPAPTYYAPPAYYGPSLGISVYGGGRYHRGWRRHHH